MKEKNTYFVFSDVHGEYDALKEGLQAAGYDHTNHKHILVSCGDSCDRGPKSKRVLDFLQCHRGVYIKGNHDVMLEEFLDKGMDGEYVLFNILHNGLGATIASLGGIKEFNFTPSILDDIAKRLRGGSYPSFIKQMPLYFETKNFIFCHAGIDPRVNDWKDTDEHFMLWDIEYSHRSMPNVGNKTVVIGHHHAFRVKENADRHLGNWVRQSDGLCRIDVESCPIVKVYGNTDEHSPYFDGNKIAIDGCVNLTKKVNILVIEDYPLEEEPEAKEEPKAETKLETQEMPQSIHTTIEQSYTGRGFTVNWGTINTTTGLW